VKTNLKMHCKNWRDYFGGKKFGGKILAGKFWRENFGGKSYISFF
jgi:hypothetical protein